MAERVTQKPVIDPSTRKDFMYFIDKEGYVAKTPYNNKKLSPEEIAKRAAKAKAKSEAYVAKRLAKAKADAAKAQATIAELSA